MTKIERRTFIGRLGAAVTLAPGLQFPSESAPTNENRSLTKVKGGRGREW
jgi:hypothetical protein